MHKEIKCPCCGYRLIDADRKIITEACAVDQVNKMEADYYVKCKKCKKEIGIRKIK